MARHTNTCCAACDVLGTIPETEEEYFSDDENEVRSKSVVVEDSSKQVRPIQRQSVWHRGIQWAFLQLLGLKQRLNYIFKNHVGCRGAFNRRVHLSGGDGISPNIEEEHSPATVFEGFYLSARPVYVADLTPGSDSPL